VDLTGHGGTADCYLGNSVGQRLSIASTQAVTLIDTGAGIANSTGYNSFGVFQGLAETVRPLDTAGLLLTSPSQGPASVRIHGAAWFHSGVGGASYDAYYGPHQGQVLYLYGGAVWLSDPDQNVAASGYYAGGVFQFLGDGEAVQPGDAGGGAVTAAPPNRVPATADDVAVNGTEDVHGNVFSLGTWQSDSTTVATAGMSVSFQDRAPGSSTGTPSTVSQVANRTANQWLWSHATAEFTATMPAMKLDSANRLTLYSPADATAQIVLDPNPQGTSTFNHPVRAQGRVRVEQRGDLTMGDFTNEPAP